MFGIFGAAALFLAGVGVYGVLSFSVSQRTQEMGVRIALGAKDRCASLLVVRQGLTVAAIGVAVGLVGAFGVTRVIQVPALQRHRNGSGQFWRRLYISKRSSPGWRATCRRAARRLSIR